MLNKLFNINHISAGFSAVLIGYTSSVIIIIQYASTLGATSGQITGWLTAIGLIMGLTSIAFSWFYKKPILTAWSTPGAAMLILVLHQVEIAVALGAFVVTGLMITITGFIPPLIKTLQRIPTALATAMLGAIVLPFCLKAFTPMSNEPLTFLLMFLTFIFSKKFIPRYTMPLLLTVTAILLIFLGSFNFQTVNLTITSPVWITPQFNLMTILNISFPLYLLTMLSQNIPGIAMLKSYEYHAPIKSTLIGTGLATTLSAPFGVFSINLAAISAAIVMNETVDTDKNQRYRAAIWAGIFYLCAGIWAGIVVNLFLAFPSYIGQILAGLALMSTLLMCFTSAFTDSNDKEAALITFLITLAGVSLFGLSAIVWGLMIGLLYKKFL